MMDVIAAVPFTTEPHSILYPCVFDQKDSPSMKGTVAQTLTEIATAFVEGVIPDVQPEQIVLWVIGSGASFNWDEAGDLDVQVWVDTEPEMIPEIRLAFEPLRGKTCADYGLVDEERSGDNQVAGTMAVQFFVRGGKGTQEETLSRMPYAAYNVREGYWAVFPKPLTAEGYAAKFLAVQSQAELIGQEIEEALAEHGKALAAHRYWTFLADMSEEFDRYEEQSAESLTEAIERCESLYDQVVVARQKAYLPGGLGIDDPRDTIVKVLEVWGLFEPLKHIVQEWRLETAAVLKVRWTEPGEYGNRTHITMEQEGTLDPTLLRNTKGAMGEVPGEHRNKQGKEWDDFVADVKANGVQVPIFITVDPGVGIRISEGNHRRDAAIEAGRKEVPVLVRYFGHSERDVRLGSAKSEEELLVELADLLIGPVPGKTYEPLFGDMGSQYGGYISQGRDGRLTLDGKPLKTLYRIVDPGEWEDAQANGYLSSDAASGSGYTRASAKPDETWRNQKGRRGYTLEIQYDPADQWHASAEGYAATHAKIPLSRVRKVGAKDWGTEWEDEINPKWMVTRHGPRGMSRERAHAAGFTDGPYFHSTDHAAAVMREGFRQVAAEEWEVAFYGNIEEFEKFDGPGPVFFGPDADEVKGYGSEIVEVWVRPGKANDAGGMTFAGGTFADVEDVCPVAVLGKEARRVAIVRTAMPTITSNPSIEDVVEWYHSVATEEEGKVSRAVQEVAKAEGGETAGFQFRIKEPKSVERKVRDKQHKGGDPRTWIGDALRYTINFHPSTYAVSVQDALYRFEEKGYKVTDPENSWARGDSYSGLHYTLITPNDVRVELQFHTDESFTLKNKALHRLYEEFRDKATPLARRQELWDVMTRYWDDVEIPDDALRFPDEKQYLRPTAAGPSWRAVGTQPVWTWYEACILTFKAGSRRTFETYVGGQQIANRHSLAEAKEAVDKEYGPQQWKREALPLVEVEHYYFGKTTEFTDPVIIYTVDFIERSKQGSKISESSVDEDYHGGHQPDSEGPPLHDVTQTGNYMDGVDVYERPQIYTGFDHLLGPVLQAMNSSRGNPSNIVTIYRAAPVGTDIERGNWVTLSRAYAQGHMESVGHEGEAWEVITKQVPAKDVLFAGDDLMEWGYWP